jgi:hypothetical protein
MFIILKIEFKLKITKCVDFFKSNLGTIVNCIPINSSSTG